MRLLRLFTALLCMALGAAIGALNPQPVRLDLGFTALDAGLGVLVLAALLAGALCGGLILALGVVAPLRRALRRAQARDAAPPAPYDMGV
jgi:putative membrane protein